MSDRAQERAKELSRLWQASIVPVEDAESAAARRERVSTAIVAKIADVAARRTMEHRRRRLGMFTAAAGVLAMLGGAWRLYEHHHSDTITSVAHASPFGHVRTIGGTAELIRAERRMTIAADTALQSGDKIMTPASTEAELSLGNRVHAHLHGSASLAVLEPTIAEHRFALSRGHIQLHVDDHPSIRPKLTVETPNAEVVVTGTVFDVDVDGTSPAGGTSTRVSVSKGRVLIRQNGLVVATVSAGQSWRSLEATTVERPADLAVNRAAERSSLVRNLPNSVIAPGTLAAENELFQSALEDKRQGDDRTAVEKLGVMLSKYPRSPLCHEARLERMRAYHRMGLTRDAAREAGRYLADYPDGAAKDEAHRFVMDEVPSE